VSSLALPRTSLGLAGVTFVGVGLAFLIDPDRLSSIVEIEARRPRASIELRAMYGGFELGLGVFFLVAAARSRWTRAALAAQVLTLSGLALGRLWGMFVTNTDRLMLLFAAIDIGGAVVGAIAFRAAKSALMNHRYGPENR
jgi:hypothetical protein